jgi:hypothetical protein
MAEPSPKEFQPYRKVQASADAEIKAILEGTAKSIQKRISMLRPGVGGVVRAAQLRLILAQVRRLQRAMWSAGITPAMNREIQAALEAGEDAVEALTRVAYGALSEPAAETLVNGFRAAAQSGFKSDAARRRKALSERVYHTRALHEGKVEEIIRQGIVSSLSAKEMAQDVYQYISPSTPGGASYAALRLARTEINNAFHERQIAGGKRPGVKAVKWNLSGSHKVPDECNLYAAHEPYDPDSVPEKPHPQCFCYLTYVTAAPGEFKKRLEAGDFDEEIARRTRENMARLGQKVGTLTPPDKKAERHLTVVADTPTGRMVPDVTNIRKSVRSGIAESEKLTGGVSAETSKVTFKDGSVGVRKFIDNSSAKRQQDAEELVPLIARMMGLKAPEVTRIDEKTTIQEFLPGKVAMGAIPFILNPGTPQAKILSSSARVKSWVDSDDGWLMAVMDQITGNQDRHDGNWLINDTDNEIAAVIDHGLAYHLRDWRTKRHDPIDLSNPYIFRTKSEFTKKFSKTNGEQTNIDFHPEDLDAIKDILETLKPEYEARGRLDWWQFSMKQIEALRPFAKGKKRRIV